MERTCQLPRWLPEWLTPPLPQWWPRLGLAAIVLGAACLSLVWVFRVPIYQAPDEPMNLDYALALCEHGNLFWVHGTSYYDLPSCVHPYTAYMAARVHTSRVAFKPGAKMPPDYGTPEFFAALNHDAPGRTSIAITGPNKPFAVYPFGYYGSLALWLRGAYLIDDQPVFVFFAARIFSVLLLAVSLIFVHGTLRLLNFKPGKALLITAAVGFFPLTSFVSSAIQMDNLSFMFISLCFYLALRARREPKHGGILACLGTALGGLLVTKVHFFLCVFAPIALMLLAEWSGHRVPWRLRVRQALLLLIPSVMTGSLYLWTTWGTSNYYGPPAGSEEPIAFTLKWFKRALLDYYGGLTHDSFWGMFGWLDTPLVIRGQRTNELIRFVIQVTGWGLLGLTLLRLEQVTSRLGRLAWCGRPVLAIRLALSNPLLNSYFLFTIMMFVLYIRLANRFGAQGRNWWPMLLPIFLTGITYAPRALTLRRSRAVLSTVVLAGLLCYCVVGSYYALRVVERRYYLSDRDRQALLEREIDPSKVGDPQPFPVKDRVEPRFKYR